MLRLSQPHYRHTRIVRPDENSELFRYASNQMIRERIALPTKQKLIEILKEKNSCTNSVLFVFCRSIKPLPPLAFPPENKYSLLACVPIEPTSAASFIFLGTLTISKCMIEKIWQSKNPRRSHIDIMSSHITVFFFCTT